MTESSFLALVYNATLLLTMAFIFDVVVVDSPRLLTLPRQAALGLILGAIGIAVMLTPWAFAPGIVFDTRSVLLAIAGLFFGALPAIVAMAMTAAFRLYQGGGGAWTGFAVILASGFIGIAWRQARHRSLTKISWIELFLFGFVVHLAMLALMFTLPRAIALRVVASIGVPLLLIYPLATALLGKLMAHRLQREETAGALHESERRFRHIYSTSSDIAYSCFSALDGHYALDWMTGAAEHITGYAIAEMLAKSCWGFLVIPEDLAIFDQQVIGLPTGSTGACELRLRHRNGEIVWVESSVECVDDPDNPGRRRLYGVLVDITKRKQAEEHLRLQAAALEAAANGIVVTDTAGTIEWTNPAFAALTGYSAQESQGHNPRDLVKSGTQDQAFYRDLWETIMAGKVWHGELINRRKDGVLYTEEQTITPVRDVHGKIAHFVAIKQDVTARRQTQDALRESEQRFRSLFEHSPMAYQSLDESGCYIDVNDRLCTLLGYRPEEILGRSFSDFWSPDTKRSFAEKFAGFKQAGLTIGELQLIRKDGTGITVLLEGQIQQDAEGKFVRTHCLLHDMTEERSVQQQLQRQERLAAIGQLAAGIAHDFNNIMSVIVMYAQMTAQAPGLTERERARLATIDQQAMRATQMIRQILDFSRRSVLERQSLDLLALLQEQIKLLKRTVPENIEIELIHDPGDYLVKGDPTRMAQLLMNLAINARDAMPQGGKLRFEVAHFALTSLKDAPLPEMETGLWVRLAVIDTGTGIAPAALEHIFEPFFTTKELGQGTGLGLAQVHGIVGQHDGHISVESQAGRGATFTIYLPALVVVTAGTPLPATLPNYPRGQGQTVLVVEDDAALRATLVELLELWNYQVREAANGAEAIALLTEEHVQIDLILSDMVMPTMGGTALFNALHRQGIRTPMIIMTGHPFGEELEGLRQLGLRGWLPKPPGAEQLAQAIAAALRA